MQKVVYEPGPLSSPGLYQAARHLQAFLSFLNICLLFWYYPEPEPFLLGDDGRLIPYWNSWWNCLWPPLIRRDFFKFRDSISLCVTCIWSWRHQMKGDANDLSIWVSSTQINELLTSVTLTSEIRAKVNKQLPLQHIYYERQVSAECHPRYRGCTITVDDNISFMKPVVAAQFSLPGPIFPGLIWPSGLLLPSSNTLLRCLTTVAKTVSKSIRPKKSSLSVSLV